MTEELRTLTGDLAGVRTEVVDGAEYLVAPVVALMEGVIHAVNASAPELVTSRELAQAPERWNGRPIFPLHPRLNGSVVAADTPGIRDRHQIGEIRGATFKDGKLLMEAWVNKARALALGGDAAEVAKRMLAGETLEVSVGTMTRLLAESGTFAGKPYKAVWHGMAPDHLAILPHTRGACSVEMGCGLPRAAELRGAGDVVGHDFHGNQFTSVSDSGNAHVNAMNERQGKSVRFQLKSEAVAKEHMQVMHDSLLNEGYKVTNSAPGYIGLDHPSGGFAEVRHSKGFVTALRSAERKMSLRDALKTLGGLMKRDTPQQQLRAAASGPLVQAIATTITSLYSLYFTAHVAHVNVEGPLFESLHAFFGSVYDDVHDSIDSFMEAIRQHDDYTPTTLERVTAAFKPGAGYAELLAAVFAANEAARVNLEQVRVLAEEDGDTGLANYCQDRAAVHRKYFWQLKALMAR